MNSFIVALIVGVSSVTGNEHCDEKPSWSGILNIQMKIYLAGNYDGGPHAMMQAARQIVNRANGVLERQLLYRMDVKEEHWNYSLLIKGWKVGCETFKNSNIDRVLDDFVVAMRGDARYYHQLLTTCNLHTPHGRRVGGAAHSPTMQHVCSGISRYQVAITGMNPDDPEWNAKTLMHELGHNLTLNHNDTGFMSYESCPNVDYCPLNCDVRQKVWSAIWQRSNQGCFFLGNGGNQGGNQGQESASVSSTDCADKWSHCTEWSREGRCHGERLTNGEIISEVCRQSCNTCGGNTVSTGGNTASADRDPLCARLHSSRCGNTSWDGKSMRDHCPSKCGRSGKRLRR